MKSTQYIIKVITSLRDLLPSKNLKDNTKCRDTTDKNMGGGGWSPNHIEKVRLGYGGIK